MEIELPEESNTRKPRMSFDMTFNLGHLFIVISLFLSAAGLYAHDESRLVAVETKVESLDNQNLPTRVSANESAIQALKGDLRDIRGTLHSIFDELVSEHKDTIQVINKVNKKADDNSKAIKDRIFP